MDIYLISYLIIGVVVGFSAGYKAVEKIDEPILVGMLVITLFLFWPVAILLGIAWYIGRVLQIMKE